MTRSERECCWCVSGVLLQNAEYENDRVCSPMRGCWVWFATEAERDLHYERCLLHLPPHFRLEYAPPARVRHSTLHWPVWVQWA